MLDASAGMRLARLFGLHSLAWSLRRLHCPVSGDSLVLEVGSGGNPYFRSNILVDAYEQTRQRHWEPLISDRPTVLGRAEKLPFKDKAFDFVIASHVLEHSSDPAIFLQELTRVAKAGYIEVPDSFMERINPYLDHRLEITVRNGVLLIKKKPRQVVDPELVELYANMASRVIAGDTMRRYPFHFHVRYYWQGAINYEILNPDVDADWPAPEVPTNVAPPSFRAQVNKMVLSAVRRIFSQNKRNRNIDLLDVLICPACGSSDVQRQGDIRCGNCDRSYPMISGIPNMTVLKTT